VKKGINLKGLIIAAVVFIVLLYLPIFSDPLAQRALALLGIVAILWISESIPLPLTGLLIPVLAISMLLLPRQSSTK
jgi:di/tricarboxylate transporter